MSRLGLLTLFICLYTSNAKSEHKSDTLMQNPFDWMIVKQLFELKENVKSNGKDIKQLSELKENVKNNSKDIKQLLKLGEDVKTNGNDIKQLLKMGEDVKTNGNDIKQLVKLKEVVQNNSKEIQSVKPEMAQLSKLLRPEGNKMCPEGWVAVLGHCYFFGMTKKTWESAKTECKNKESYLLQLESAEESTLLAAKFSAKRYLNKNIWMGANNLSGQWKWHGSNKQVKWFNWYKGEPNNVGNNENCMEWYLYPEYGYQWNDKVCNALIHYICEQN